MPTTAGDGAYQIKITLDGARPPIWRRVQVPGDISLAGLHQVIQAAMGWENYHLYAFFIDGKSYCPPDEDVEAGLSNDLDPSCFMLGQVLPAPGVRLSYVYDFGDEWRHDLLVEKTLPIEGGRTSPKCIAGRRACPPEDCGGIYGYAELVEAMKTSSHPRYAEIVDWLGQPFDADGFSVTAANEELRGLLGVQ